jgi:hypothetical protein
VVDLDTLNTLLVAINTIYLAQAETESPAELRVTIANAVAKL